MSEQQKRRSGFVETAVIFAIAIVLAWLIRTFVVESFVVKGVSMQPTFYTGYRVLVDKLATRLYSLKTGEIVVFHSPVRPRQDWIKRVIGVPGDTVSIRNSNVYINGHLYREPFLKYRQSISVAPLKVPPGYLWVLGDNRPDSYDSRYFGLLPMKKVIGQAFLVWWPPGQIKVLS